MVELYKQNCNTSEALLSVIEQSENNTFEGKKTRSKLTRVQTDQIAQQRSKHRKERSHDNSINTDSDNTIGSGDEDVTQRKELKVNEVSDGVSEDSDASKIEDSLTEPKPILQAETAGGKETGEATQQMEY